MPKREPLTIKISAQEARFITSAGGWEISWSDEGLSVWPVRDDMKSEDYDGALQAVISVSDRISREWQRREKRRK